MDNTIVTRFCPSPSGSLHIGGARTALFNFAYAKQNGGRFVFRIEDTDQKRSTKASADGMMDDMRWLGITWTDGPFYQSERLEIYSKYAKQMLDSGDAKKKDGSIVVPKSKVDSVFYDSILCKRVLIRPDDLSDTVILRADGYPTYHFAVVVDDCLMGVNNVLRAQEHIYNTARHIQLYDLLGWTRPTYGHMPLIMNQDGSKMSKRPKICPKTGKEVYPKVNISDFKKDGYLPSAIINYLGRLGWGGQADEIFDLDYYTRVFDIGYIRKNNPKFDEYQLNRINKAHILRMPDEEFIDIAFKYTNEFGDTSTKALANKTNGKQFLLACKNRISKLSEISKYNSGLIELTNKIAIEKSDKDILKIISGDIDNIIANPMVSLKQISMNLGVKINDVVAPFRMAITGSDVSLPIDQTIAFIGTDVVKERINNVIKQSKGKRSRSNKDDGRLSVRSG